MIACPGANPEEVFVPAEAMVIGAGHPLTILQLGSL
jgi:hypothetical protein